VGQHAPRLRSNEIEGARGISERRRHSPIRYHVSLPRIASTFAISARDSEICFCAAVMCFEVSFSDSNTRSIYFESASTHRSNVNSGMLCSRSLSAIGLSATDARRSVPVMQHG
jgi:hypothetical protein